MKDNNIISLIGNVGKDPEVKTLSSGVKLAKFSLATTDNYKDKSGEWQSETIWHDCIAWAKTADLIERGVTKGAFLRIQGKLVYNRWEDENGVKRKNAVIRVDSVLFLQKPPKKETSDGYGSSVPAGTSVPETTEDMPF